MLDSMFHLHLPILEKVLRPIIIYLVLIAFLRLFGKRELAQLNPFDLVVLLSLSNTVQNAIIGEDNSVTGGLIGAFAMLSANWLVSRLLFHLPRLNAALEGGSTTLITDGVCDRAAMKRETLTDEELLTVLHKQGYDRVAEVKTCTLEPGGTFYVEGRKPTEAETGHGEMMAAIRRLSSEVESLRLDLARR